MTAARMRRRYRTASPKRGLLWLFLLVLLASLYIGQRVYSQRLTVTLDGREQKLKTMAAHLESLRAERDRLTSPGVLGPRASALGLRPAEVKQLARVPLSVPSALPDSAQAETGLLAAFGRVWRWLDPPNVQNQEVLAAP